LGAAFTVGGAISAALRDAGRGRIQVLDIAALRRVAATVEEKPR